jgi:hypothetical protein
MTTNTTTWTGAAPESCDICHDPIASTFIDGIVRNGPWAIMCTYCHNLWGVGLGLGRGQRYVRQPDDTWLKVEG